MVRILMNSPTALVRLRARWEGSQNVATELSELAICGSVFPHPHLDGILRFVNGSLLRVWGD